MFFCRFYRTVCGFHFQFRFHSLVSMYYRGAQAAVVVYDIQNHDSFRRAQAWVMTLKNQVNILQTVKIFYFVKSNNIFDVSSNSFLQKNPPTNVIALAANKCEPLKCHSAVSLNEVMKYANENGLIFMETSAKTALNVQELFITIGMYFIWWENQWFDS